MTGLFVLEDIVEWSAGAGAAVRKFRGVVAEVVPAGMAPRITGARILARDTRDHESYIVRAGTGRFYWPRVASLGKVAPPLTATETDRALLRAAEANALARPPHPRKLTWLNLIERLEVGDQCEARGAGSEEWHLCTVERNGMAGLWRVRIVATGKVFHPYIERVRCVGQIEAWPPYGEPELA